MTWLKIVGLLLLSCPAFAHEYVLAPFEISAASYNNRIEMELNGVAELWWNEIIGPMPAGVWPDDLQKKAIHYIQDHWKVQADGQPLIPLLQEARYGEKVYDVRYGYVHLRWIYVLPPTFQKLQMTSYLYQDYLDREKDDKHPPFRFDLAIRGATQRVIPFNEPGHSEEFTAMDLRRSHVSFIAEGFRKALPWMINSLSFLLGIVALALNWRSDKSRMVLVVAILAGFGIILFSIAPVWAWRAAFAGVAFLSLALFGQEPRAGLETIGAAFWAGALGLLINGRWNELLGTPAYPWVKSGFALADLLVIALGVALVGAVAFFTRKRLERLSPATASAQYHSYRRIAGGLMLFISLYGGLVG